MQSTAAIPSVETADTGANLRLYVGTRAAGQNHIHCLSLDIASAALHPAAQPVAADNPSFLALRPDGTTLYAVHELGHTRAEHYGAVSVFAVDGESGRLALLNRQQTRGAAPCHMRPGPEGRRLFVANYWGGSFSAFPIAADGSIGDCAAFVQHSGGTDTPGRDPGPHVHWASPDPAGRRLFVADLGRDEMLAYRLDPRGMPIEADVVAYRFPEGTGPRHAVFLTGSRKLAVAAELASTVTLLDCDVDAGRLSPEPALSTLPEDWRGENAVAEIAATPDERFLYVSNRGHDSLAIFRLDPSTGTIARTGFCPTGGAWPRHFAIDPSGRLLVVANQRSDDVRVFRIDRDSGALRPTGSAFAVAAPTCVVIAPTMDHS